MKSKLDIKVLLLDDNPERAERFYQTYPQAVWVETSSECIEKLAEEWDLISLDHDLGGESFVDSNRQDCGMEVVRWLRDNRPEHLKNANFVVHSLNGNAAMMMIETLRETGYRCVYKPFIMAN